LKAGNLNVLEFLSQTRNILETRGNLLSEAFDFDALRYRDEISYKDLRSKRIIFTEGYLIKNNPFFNYIPLKPAKGEVLTVKCERLELGSDILNKNMFVLPTANSTFKTGATYDWSDLNDSITEKGKKELQEKLDKLITTDREIVLQEAGVRPSVIDRRPVMGKHPQHSNILVFNGMGTKGVMLAPYFAKQLADHLLKGTAINPEVDVQRFNKFFVN
jgi:glycine oxidase